MKYFVVNRNSLDVIDEIESETETAMSVSDKDGINYTRFGPVLFLFDNKKAADILAERFLTEEIGVLEGRLKQIKQKKTNLSQSK